MHPYTISARVVGLFIQRLIALTTKILVHCGGCTTTAAFVLNVFLDRAVTHTLADKFKQGWHFNLFLARVLNSNLELTSPRLLRSDLREVRKHLLIIPEHCVADGSHRQVNISCFGITNSDFYFQR